MRRPRLTELLVVLAACGSRSHEGDAVIGTWGDPRAPFELRADGSLHKPPTVDRRCEDLSEVITRCAAGQTWDRDGATVTLRMAVVSQPVPDGLVGLAAERPAGEARCVCAYDPIEARYTGDALVVGKERAVRVR